MAERHGNAVRGVVRPDSDCVYAANLDRAITEGSWDLASPDVYLMFVVVENTLESATRGEVELNQINVDAVHITLLHPDGTELEFPQAYPNPFVVGSLAVVPPTEGAIPSRSLLMAIVPNGFAGVVGDLDLAELTVRLQPTGTLPDGTLIRSEAIEFPVRLCQRCLSTQCVEPDPPEGSCTPGQDGDLWCES